MAQLPTVVMEHRRSGRREIRNYAEVSQNIANYASKDWKIVSVRGGDATDAQVRAAIREAEIDKFRDTDPKEIRKRGDHRRAYEERAITVLAPHEGERVEIAAPASREVAGNDYPEPTPAPPPEAPPKRKTRAKPKVKAKAETDWHDMPWFAARSYVKKATGTLPNSKAHAEALMIALEPGSADAS